MAILRRTALNMVRTGETDVSIGLLAMAAALP